VGYKLLASKGDEPEVKQEVTSSSKSVIVALDPFVLNLSDRGRYLKVTLKFEITDSSLQAVVKEKTPQLRDTIITLVSSKSLNSISSPEGKFQLKDEVLFRANQIMGMDKDIFKNLFFTEFVMQ
jgi:flagellar FliL protein